MRFPSWIPLVLVVAAGCGAATPVPAPAPAGFMDCVREQVAGGPRVPGTAAHEAWLAAMQLRLRAAGARLTVQEFRDTVPGFGETALTNVVASFGPESGRALLLCAHWDSRPWCDRDPDSTLRAKPLPGANDGGSGVAVLLLLADALHARAPGRRIDLVFLDGEDLGSEAHPEGFFRGSSYFARHLPAKYSMGFLLDMVGGRGAVFRREPNSMLLAPAAVEALWKEAGRQKLAAFSEEIGTTVGDDHLPLNRAGIPTADIIDLSYPEWHTSRDLPEAMAPEGMVACFQVLAGLIYRR